MRGEEPPNYLFSVLVLCICVFFVSLAGLFAYRRSFGVTAAIGAVGLPVTFGLIWRDRTSKNREKPLPHIDIPPAKQTGS
jgi:hypothetical protein